MIVKMNQRIIAFSCLSNLGETTLLFISFKQVSSNEPVMKVHTKLHSEILSLFVSNL